MPRTPARINQLPFPIINLNGVPGMCGSEGRDWLAGLERLVSIALAGSRTHHRLEARLECQGCEQPGIAFTYREAACNRLFRGTGLDCLMKEGINIVVHVMM